jgi:malate synthase
MAITVTDPRPIERAEEILTPKALAFVEELHKRFAGTRKELLAARGVKRQRVAETGKLDFLPETQDVRDGDWQVAPAPEALQDRRVEMTGPASPAKMAINALNSGAQVWLADLEDASTPTWSNVIDSILNLRDAATGSLSYTSPDGKEYTLRTDAPLAVVVARPRGWHLPEKHLLIDGEPAVGALVDFGLHFFHVAKQLVLNGHGPYYYLPKMESHLEARLWNEVFVYAQDFLGLGQGTIRATVLIETIPAAFEMDEILYELRDHASGLNAGRWDYLFSIIKYFRDAGEEFVLPDRASVVMTAPNSWSRPATGAARSPWAAWPPSSPTAATRRSPKRPSPRSARTRRGRPMTASMVPGLLTRTWSPRAARCSTPCSASAPTSWTSSAPRFPSRPISSWTSPRLTARSPKAGCA